MIEIRTADLFATPPTTWWERLICQIIKAKTWHWGAFIVKDANGWIITESIGKGIAVTRFDYKQAYIYRIKELGQVGFSDVLSVISYYGVYPYDWDVPFKTAIWWLLGHYLGKTIPHWHDKEVNCQEWVVLLASEQMGCVP